MKMKEHFPEAFQVDGNPSFGIQNCVWTTFGEDEQSTADQDSAIEHAVLNHDRMVEELKSKTDMLALVVEEKSRMMEDIEELKEFVCSLQLDVSNEIKLENLLAKLNQEGEE